MSKNQVDFCAAITKDYFGPEVARVAQFLARNGSSVFRCLCSKGGFPEKMLKKSLWVLIQHNFVDVTVTQSGLTVYKINLNYILQKTRHFKFMYMVKCLYGDESKMIVEEISRHGKVDPCDVITSLSSQTGASRETLQEKWNQMKGDSLIVQCPLLDSSELQQTNSTPHKSCTTTNNNGATGMKARKRKNVVDSDEEADDKNVEPASKKFKSEGLWKLNSSKFNELLRNQIIIETMAMKIDRRSADIVKAILRLSELSQLQKNVANRFRTFGVTCNEIFSCLKKQMTSLTLLQLDQMLKILLEDANSILKYALSDMHVCIRWRDGPTAAVHCRSLPETSNPGDAFLHSSFVMKDGDSGGGVYRIDFQQAFTELGLAHVTSVIQERYGSKSLRIFRVVMLKKKIEQKQIEDLVMMDPKEAKELLYKLLEDNILFLTLYINVYKSLDGGLGVKASGKERVQVKD
ncbi:hypothetical protein HELRODRAFT_193781 [Helobdella robusta]|uniref:DNA-directed RNA polymerase III subunit RPC3 n=1 Tax=Helobdella robusta TaxID=6412 RepID=T1FVC6_HELRO|nr:hypothetical protein HELRODRAFT_193781 [Helobdella robusta]ESN94762.1 hypothetical protein HELRODRAFT_193781 [Helobdella robusta]